MSSSHNANTGSRARDHLANERTYLAWVRTALGGLALAIAVERFGAGQRETSLRVFAAVLIVMAVALLGMATRRYFTVARNLDLGLFEVDRTSPFVILIAGVGLAALSIILFV